MTDKEVDPESGDLGAKVKRDDQKTPKLNQSPNQSPPGKHYWLHVRADGTEVRFNHEPDWVPTLCVFVDGKTEYTWTTAVEGVFQPVKPRGRGWVEEVEINKSTRWIRSVKP